MIQIKKMCGGNDLDGDKCGGNDLDNENMWWY